MSPRLSRNDTMLSTTVPQYFGIGAEALTRVEQCLVETGHPDPASVLDFPCGHGRVLRMFAARWPSATLAAGDLDVAGVEFCAKEFGARPVLSHDDLDVVDAGMAFDLAWCGSLLTHFPEARWASTLRFFQRHLAAGGLLVFTTHGDYSARVLAGEAEIPSLAHRYGFAPSTADLILADFRQHGFAYRVYDGDDPASGYGHSVSAPSWVEAQIAAAGMELELVIEGGWGLHQDVYACSGGRS